MSTSRYGFNKQYRKFTDYAKAGDKILREVNNTIIKHGGFDSEQRNRLHSLLNSNAFISGFDVPFKYKLPLLNKDMNVAKRGDIVEAYIWWRYVNYGLKSAESYIETEIIKITSKIK